MDDLITAVEKNIGWIALAVAIWALAFALPDEEAKSEPAAPAVLDDSQKTDTSLSYPQDPPPTA